MLAFAYLLETALAFVSRWAARAIILLFAGIASYLWYQAICGVSANPNNGMNVLIATLVTVFITVGFWPEAKPWRL